MKIFLATETDIRVERDVALQDKLRDRLLAYQATVLEGDDDLEDADAVIAELSHQSPELLSTVQRGLELGKATLLLARATGRLAIPETFRGQSAIRPDGVRYSQDYSAVSALTLFMDLQFKTLPPGIANRLEHPMSEELEIRKLGLDAQALLDLGLDKD